MKILHYIPELTLYSGVTVFGVEVANLQADSGHDIWVVYSDDASYRPAPNVQTVLAPSVAGYQVDVVHIHALWMFCLVRAMFYCWRHRIPYVVSTHGGLMPRVFSKGRIKKFLCWHLLLKPLLKRASAIHCTSEAEVAACRRLGLTGPFVVAPLGVRVPSIDLKGKLSQSPERIRTILFLGRISEEKGLLNLLSAWRRIHSELQGRQWVLKISGPDWRRYKRHLDAKITSEGITDVVFTGAADEILKDQLYHEADIYVLPSPMENFSMGVLEALSYGIPVIATNGTPWQSLESEHCGLWIDQGEDALYEALSNLMRLSDSERVNLGKNGRALAKSQYQWSAIAGKLLETYRSISK